MNTDNETKKRFKFKLYNAHKDVAALSEFIQVHNEDDESPAYRRGCELQDELDHMKTRLAALFDGLEK